MILFATLSISRTETMIHILFFTSDKNFLKNINKLLCNKNPNQTKMRIPYFNY